AFRRSSTFPDSHIIFVFFFFSSRRRHTRWPRDWSSDVCSSDLAQVAPAYADLAPAIVIHGPLRHPRDECVRAAAVLEDEARLGPVRPREHHAGAAVIAVGRSEERRVGKEGRWRGSSVW